MKNKLTNVINVTNKIDVNISSMSNLAVKERQIGIEELVGILEFYNHKTILMSNWIDGVDDSHRLQTLDNVSVYGTEGNNDTLSSICIEAGDEDVIGFPLSRLEDIHIVEMDIFEDEDAILQVVFGYMGMSYLMENVG